MVIDCDFEQESSEYVAVGSKRKYVERADCSAKIIGGVEVAEKCQVIKHRSENCTRQPNLPCRVESCGRMCTNFDDMRRSWVVEMGFGGLLYLDGKQLPRNFCYWLMTRIYPKTQMIVDGGGQEFRLSANQLRWILGLPIGGRGVPGRRLSKESLTRLKEECGREMEVFEKLTGGFDMKKGLAITPSMLERVEGKWEEEEKAKFQMLFLMLKLQMVLCPTQCPKLSSDLLCCVPFAIEARQYDWCSLVLDKLIKSVKVFRQTFEKKGYATGCGGCCIFVAIYYLDRLPRNALSWVEWPWLKVWNNYEMRRAVSEDRVNKYGDFGAKKLLNVAYGEIHPRDARDSYVTGEGVDMGPASRVAKCRRKGKATKFPMVRLAVTNDGELDGGSEEGVSC